VNPNGGVNELAAGSWSRAEADRALNARRTEATEITLPRAKRSREWLTVALVSLGRQL